MPKSKIIYAGILIVAATALMWAGKYVLDKIEYFFPYAFGAGALVIVVGVLFELRKNSVQKGGGGSPPDPSVD